MTPTAECTLGTSPPKPCSVSDRRRSGAGSSAAPWQQRVWRTSARRGRPDWTDRPREVVEAALARVVGNRTEAAPLRPVRALAAADRCRPVSRQPVVHAERPPENGPGVHRGRGLMCQPAPLPSGAAGENRARCARSGVAALCAATETSSPDWQGHTRQRPRGKNAGGTCPAPARSRRSPTIARPGAGEDAAARGSTSSAWPGWPTWGRCVHRGPRSRVRCGSDYTSARRMT